MWNLFRPFLSRVLGGLAAGLATKAAEKGITVDPAALVSIGLTVFAIVHKIIDKKVNPADGASTSVILEGLEVNEELEAKKENKEMAEKQYKYTDKI